MTTEHRPPEFLDEEKFLACVHCGLCLGACPTYLETGSENESPRGRIYIMRALQDGRLPLEKESIRHLDLCLGCRACEVACPSGVQYGALLEQTRDFVESNFKRSPYQTFLRRIFIEKVFPVPRRLKLALLPSQFLKSTGLDRLLPRTLRDPLDLLPAKAESWDPPEFSPALSQPAKGKVGFIRGCVMSVLFGETNRATIELLNRAGYDVLTPQAQVCCGALFAHSGKLSEAREHAKRNIAAFKSLQLDAIIINAAGCGSTLKEYGHLLHGDPEWALAAAQFSAKMRDITEFLVNHGMHRHKFTISGRRVTYHDACHLAHPQRITRQPRDLVRAVAGPNYVELPEADVCCGSAGSYNLTEPAMAERLQQRKIENVLKTGAEIVVTANPGCILQIESGLRKAGQREVQVLHIVDFLARALEANV